METVLFLILLAWIFGKSKKSGKKRSRRRKWTAEMHRQMERAMHAPQKEVVKEQEEAEAVPAFQPLSEGQSHMAFTQDVHGCLSEREEYMGSMNADTSEGEDACDLALEHERKERIDSQSVYAQEIGTEPLLDLSAKGIYQGVVMSEILARPQRHSVRRF